MAQEPDPWGTIVRLSRRSEYALLAAVDLAASAAGGRVQLHEIAARRHIPVKYLEQLLRPLRAAGVIVSMRGSRGGYQLARPADQVTVLEVVEAIEGPLGQSDEEPLPGTGSATIRALWHAAARTAAEELARVSIAGLAARCARDREDGDDWVI